MKIGELAAATGLAPSAIRFYEQSGLLPEAQRAPNGYRSYSPDAVDRLRYIQLAQALGFTLDTLRAGLVDRANILPLPVVCRRAPHRQRDRPVTEAGSARAR